MAKILHSEPNVQEWVEIFDEYHFGTAIIVMGSDTDGAMFVVTKRRGGQCFVQQIYNVGGYMCYKAPTEEVKDRVVLSLGRNGTYFTREIIVIGSVK